MQPPLRVPSGTRRKRIRETGLLTAKGSAREWASGPRRRMLTLTIIQAQVSQRTLHLAGNPLFDVAD